MPTTKTKTNITWPKELIRISVDQIPREVKQWLRRSFNADLLPGDHIAFHLSTDQTKLNHRRRAENALRNHGLDEKQIQKVIRMLPT
jgi:hypothetical protein